MAFQPSGERGVYRIPATALRVFQMRQVGRGHSSQGPRAVEGPPLDLWADRIKPVLDETRLTADELLRRMAADQALVVRYPTFATDYAAYVTEMAMATVQRTAHA